MNSTKSSIGIYDISSTEKNSSIILLEDQAEFNQFKIVDGTVEWKCGADLSQDTFYLESVPASEINAIG
jgi:hypothetical protein